MPVRRVDPADISPAVTGDAPKIARASSVRPAPTSPARATISPARISSDAPFTPAAVRSRTVRAGGASAGGTCFGGYVRLTERPSIAATSESSVSSEAGPVFTTFPSRRTVIVSASASTSPRKWETRITVRPLRVRVRTMSWNRWTSIADRAAVGSSNTISSASRARARRISTCCCLASGSEPTMASAGTSRPASATRRSNRSSRRRRWTKPKRRGSVPRKTFSATVRRGTTAISWATSAIPRESASRGDRNATVSPRSASWP